jgi:hypothetical protein
VPEKRNPVRRFALLVPVVSASLALVACSRSFHPEYHPQTATTYVQNVVYAHNVAYGASGELSTAASPEGVAIAYPTGVDLAMANPYLFTAPASTAVPATTAPAAQPHRVGTVASPGAVVVYGNVNGNIVLGR